MSYSALPSPLMFAIKAATRTRRIRFGTAVLVLPFYHPLRIAKNMTHREAMRSLRLFGQEVLPAFR